MLELCLMPTSAVFQQYRGVEKIYRLITPSTGPFEIKRTFVNKTIGLYVHNDNLHIQNVCVIINMKS